MPLLLPYSEELLFYQLREGKFSLFRHLRQMGTFLSGALQGPYYVNGSTICSLEMDRIHNSLTT